MSAYSVSAHGLAMRKVPQGVLDTVNQLLFDAGQVGGNLSFPDFSKIWQDSAGTTPYTAVEQYVGKIIDKSPNALAFTQATSAARPAVSARVNLLTKTRGASLLANYTTTDNVIPPPTGVSTSTQIVATATPAAPIVISTATSTSIVASCYFHTTSTETIRTILLRNATISNNLATVAVNLTTGAKTAGGVNSTVTYAGGGWYKLQISQSTGISVGDALYLYLGRAATEATGVAWNIAGPSMVPAGRETLPHQWADSSSSYATTGFPNYAKFDSIDDNWVSAAGGGGTAGIYYCGAIQFNKVGAVQTILSDAGTNSGYKLQLTAANQLQISAGNGTAFTAINTTDVFALGDVSLCELWDDGTNLGVRLGEGTPVTVARPVVTAGTAQITLGKDNNAASNYAGIGMFEPVWRYGAMPNATQREAIRAICRSKAGVV